MKLLGKVTKVTLLAEGGVAAGKAIKHIANGEVGAALGVAKDFAYDQTIGTAKGLYDLGKSALSGIGDAIFGPSEPKPPARRSRARLRDFAQGMMMLTYIVGSAIEASRAEPAPEPEPEGASFGAQRAPAFEHPFMPYPIWTGPLPIGPPIWVWRR
jgi:hypothetical protein